VQAHQRARGEHQADAERDQPAEVVHRRSRPAAEAEGQPAIGRRVADRGQQQAQRVGGLRAHEAAQRQVDHDVSQRGERADGSEAGQLPRQAAPRPDVGLAQPRHLERAPGEAEADPLDPAQVAQRGVDDVDPRVGVVDPVHWHLVDAQPGPFGQHQQLGVEEPALVLDQRQQLPGLVGPDRLKPALGVGEAGPEGGPQQQVVAARDDLALGAADHPRSAGQPGADGDVAVPRHQRRDQR